MPRRPTFAYLLERYPAFTQTFVAREVAEMRRQGVPAPVFSLRPSDASFAANPDPHFPPEAVSHVTTAPAKEELIAEIKRRRAAGELPRKINDRLHAWGSDPDKGRLYEAIWAGEILRRQGIRHLHVHFAGIAARTAFLIKELYGITYSFTGHALDIFCQSPHAIGLGPLTREAKIIITVADYSARLIEEKYPACAHKIHRVYNGIALPSALPSPTPPAPNLPPLILSVGRLIPKKGFTDLLHACALLRDAGTPFHLQIVGDGPLTDELTALIAQLHLQNHVVLHGALPQPEVARLLTRAQIFALAAVVLPDGDSDNLPTVLTEAMAHGLPVVSTQVAGIPEQVLEGRTGWLVAPGDRPALAERLTRLLQDPALAQKMGRAGFDHAQAEFSLISTVRKLRRLLPTRPWWHF